MISTANLILSLVLVATPMVRTSEFTIVDPDDIDYGYIRCHSMWSSEMQKQAVLNWENAYPVNNYNNRCNQYALYVDEQWLTERKNRERRKMTRSDMADSCDNGSVKNVHVILSSRFYGDTPQPWQVRSLFTNKRVHR